MAKTHWTASYREGSAQPACITVSRRTNFGCTASLTHVTCLKCLQVAARKERELRCKGQRSGKDKTKPNVHYMVPWHGDNVRLACGASTWRNEGTYIPSKVTCGSCKRTMAFREMMS